MSLKIFTGLGILPNLTKAFTDKKVITVEKLKTTAAPLSSFNSANVGTMSNQPVPLGTPIQKINMQIQDLQNKIFEPSRVDSQQSIAGVYSTIFDKFDFKANVTYNFFVEDEETNDKEAYDGRPLDDVPRYITLTWKKAPQKKDLKKGQFTDKTAKESSRYPGPLIINRGGLAFEPSAMDVLTAINYIANGYIAPGTIRANVSMGSTTKVDNTHDNINEDLFLASDEKIYSVNELKSNIRSATETAPFSSNSELVSGKYMLQKSLSENSLSLKSGQPSSPSISLLTSTAKSNKILPTSIDLLKKIADKFLHPFKQNTSNQLMTKVNFTEPNIASTVSIEKVDGATKPEHAESIIGLGILLPSFERVTQMLPIFQKFEPPTLPVAEEYNGIEYIGYVIEKYRRNKSGVFELIEDIVIDDREIEEYIDTRISYGSTYRYRMKTILRWVHPKNVNVNGTINENSVLDKFSQTKNLAGSNATFFESDWSRNWEYVSVIDLVPPEPPDEVYVRPVSSKKQIHISWKMPVDFQKDISGFILYRKLIDQSNEFVSSWVRLSDILPPKNGLFIDEHVEYKEENGGLGYVYAVQTVTAHYEYSSLSDQIAAWISEEAAQIGEIPAKFISESGVSLMMHGQFSVKPIKKIEKEIIAKDIVSFIGKVGDSQSRFDDTTYTIRLTSLDTGERKEFEIYVDYIDMQGYVKEVPTVVLFSNSTPPKSLTVDTVVVGPATKDKGLILSKLTLSPSKR